jgi:hypothetical protein
MFLGDCAELASENLSCGLLFGGLVGPAETPRSAGPRCIHRGLTPVRYAVLRRRSERGEGTKCRRFLFPTLLVNPVNLAFWQRLAQFLHPRVRHTRACEVQLGEVYESLELGKARVRNLRP